MRVYVVLALLHIAEQKARCGSPLKLESSIPLLGDTSPEIRLNTESLSFPKLDHLLQQAIVKSAGVVLDPRNHAKMKPITDPISLFDKLFYPVKANKRPGSVDVIAYEVQAGTRRGEWKKSGKLCRLQFAVEDPAPPAFAGVTRELYSDLVKSGYYDMNSKVDSLDMQDVLGVQSNIYTADAAERDLYFRRLLGTVNVELDDIDSQVRLPSPMVWSKATQLDDSTAASPRRIVSVSDFKHFVTIDEFRAQLQEKRHTVYKKTWLDGTIVARALGRRNADRANAKQPFVDPSPPSPKRLRFQGANSGKWSSVKRMVREIPVNIFARTTMGRKVLRIIENRQHTKNMLTQGQGVELLKVAIAGYVELARLHDAGVVMGQITKDSVLIRYVKSEDRYEVRFRDFRAAVRPKTLPLGFDTVNRGNMHNIPWTKEKDAFDWAIVIQNLQGTYTPKMAKWRDVLAQSTEHYQEGSSILNHWDRFQNSHSGRGDAIQSLISKMLKLPPRSRYRPPVKTFSTEEMGFFLHGMLTKVYELGVHDGIQILPVRHHEHVATRKKPWPNEEFSNTVNTFAALIHDSPHLKTFLDLDA